MNRTSTTAEVLSTLDAKLGELAAHTKSRKDVSEAHDAQVIKTLKEIQDKRDANKASGKGTSGGGRPLGASGSSSGVFHDQRGGDEMDVDDPADAHASGRSKGRKWVHIVFLTWGTLDGLLSVGLFL